MEVGAAVSPLGVGAVTLAIWPSTGGGLVSGVTAALASFSRASRSRVSRSATSASSLRWRLMRAGFLAVATMMEAGGGAGWAPGGGGVGSSGRAGSFWLISV